MLSDLDAFYMNLPEPNQSCFLALRDFILQTHEDITPEWKYKLPFFYLKGKMFCYLWKDKDKNQMPYIGFAQSENMHHPLLEQGDRKRMKVLYIDANEDLPIDMLSEVFEEALNTFTVQKKGRFS